MKPLLRAFKTDCRRSLLFWQLCSWGRSDVLILRFFPRQPSLGWVWQVPPPMMLASIHSVLPDSQPGRVHLSSMLVLLATFLKWVHHHLDSCRVEVVGSSNQNPLSWGSAWDEHLVDQGCYFERAHLGLGSRRGCTTGACDVLRNMRDRSIEGVNLKGKIYQHALMVSTCCQCSEQMNRTDVYSQVTWSKPGELDGSMISAVTVWFSLLFIYSIQFLVWTLRLVKTSINFVAKDAL